MTRILDRMLRIAAPSADASAACPPDPYTDTWVRCFSNGQYFETCRRTCSTNGACVTHCSAYTCLCEAHHSSCGQHYS